ncbi:MAG: alpha/beta hydrolase [Cyanobacteria bacterium J06638_22]
MQATQKQKSRTLSAVSKWISKASTAAIAFLLGIGLALAPAQALESIRAAIGPIEFSGEMSEIEAFVEEGELSTGLVWLERFTDSETVEGLRVLLQTPIELDATVVAKLTYSSLGENFLQRLGKIIRTEAGQNGFYAMRAALILAADAPEDLTLLSILQHVPVESIRIDMEATIALVRDFLAQQDTKADALEAIARQAEYEGAATGDRFNFALSSDLRQPGPYPVTVQSLMLSDATRSGPVNPMVRQFSVDLYLPQGLSQAAPVVIISHGLGAEAAEFAVLAEHLASYGFAVAAPDHVGSDAAIFEEIIAGNYFGRLDASEFSDRPQDVTFLLDELERRARTGGPLSGQISLERVGIIGHSFGGYTGLVLASGEINHAKLDSTCTEEDPFLNLSLFLQCQAVALPPSIESLKDPRIGAVLALNPIPSTLLGQASLSQIDVPVMIVQSSEDILAPIVPEQIEPFNWLTTPQKYLVTLSPAGHGSANQTELLEENLANSLLTGPNTFLGSVYTRSLSVAFMQRHISNQSRYEPYLTAAYGAYLSQEPLQVSVITDSVAALTDQD